MHCKIRISLIKKFVSKYNGINEYNILYESYDMMPDV